MFDNVLVFEFLFCLMDALICTKFCDWFFTRKYQSVGSFIIFNICFALVIYVLTIMYNINSVFLLAAAYVVYTVTLYESKNYILKVIYPVLFYFIYGFITLILLSVCGFILNVPLYTIQGENYVYRIIFITVTKILIFCILNLLSKKKVQEISMIHLRQTIFWVIGVTVLLMIYYFYYLIALSEYPYHNQSFLIIGVFIGIVILCVIRILKMYIDSKVETENYRHAIQNNERINNLYLKRAQNNHDLMLLKHDFRNILHSLNFYLEKGEVEKSHEIVKKLYSRDIFVSNIDSGNELLDALLEIKISDNKDINFKLNIDIINLKIDAIDLSRLLGNALDNAIEAASLCKRKEVEIIIKEDESVIFIMIKNTYKNKPKRNTTSFFSSKRNNQEGGYGILSMETIASKYDGTVDLNFQENLACLEIYLFIEQININTEIKK